MRGTLRSTAVVTGALTLAVVVVVILSPVIIAAGIFNAIWLTAVSFGPSRWVSAVAGKIADIQLAMGRTMARKVRGRMK